MLITINPATNPETIIKKAKVNPTRVFNPIFCGLGLAFSKFLSSILEFYTFSIGDAEDQFLHSKGGPQFRKSIPDFIDKVKELTSESISYLFLKVITALHPQF